MRFLHFRSRLIPIKRKEITMSSDITVTIDDSSIDTLITTSAEATRVESLSTLTAPVEIDPENLIETSAAAFRAAQLASDPVVEA